MKKYLGIVVILFFLIGLSLFTGCSGGTSKLSNVNFIHGGPSKVSTSQLPFTGGKPLYMAISFDPTKITDNSPFTLSVDLLNTGDFSIPSGAKITIEGIDPNDFGGHSFMQTLGHSLDPVSPQEISNVHVSNPVRDFGTSVDFSNLKYAQKIQNPIQFQVFADAIFKYQTSADMTFCAEKNVKMSNGCNINSVSKMSVSKGYIDVSTPVISIISDDPSSVKLQVQFKITKKFSDASISSTESFSDDFDSLNLNLVVRKQYFKLVKAMFFGRKTVTKDVSGSSVSVTNLPMSSGQITVNLFFTVDKNGFSGTYDYVPFSLTSSYYVEQKTSSTLSIKPQSQI